MGPPAPEAIREPLETQTDTPSGWRRKGGGGTAEPSQCSDELIQPQSPTGGSMATLRGGCPWIRSRGPSKPNGRSHG